MIAYAFDGEGCAVQVFFPSDAKVAAFLFVFVLSFTSGSVWLFRFVSSVLFMA